MTFRPTESRRSIYRFGPKRRRPAVESALASSSDAPELYKPQRLRGMLANLPEMPLDILYEIFSYLAPADILNLSWTSKGLHDALVRRSAQYVWKRARANVPGLPDCPEDLTEPAYARLCFDDHCEVRAASSAP
ncbi:hypothetical protein PUNSTDRAFT_64519 [Punctularia strigosozonata HHB-11173 SS5]|uniref:uncharacterized protein n=1 Tax=Punctularia strigosozonata (strain HHB-11173) TaxID=741275 RepID=UPI0004416D6A|nr:uncharacterized protein PUNSTDRAFT_64519 [Punctularia strigosozonata HHB-11173 SS5]EIN11005.1 hypothetical protein PUNSTDRAFT_64519 [Punctularia strigosozonata HHB-11173 SS5]